MPRRAWRLRIEDILSSIERIQRYIAGMTYDEFCADERTADAVVRNIEIIGEAARHVPSDLQARYPRVPWRQMRDMRNALIHDYADVSLAIAWDTAQHDLPPLVALLTDLLRAEP